MNITPIVLAYIIGLITGTGISDEDTKSKRTVWIIMMGIIGFGIYYLLKLMGLE